jgi:hypothetical protein
VGFEEEEVEWKNGRITGSKKPNGTPEAVVVSTEF